MKGWNLKSINRYMEICNAAFFTQAKRTFPLEWRNPLSAELLSFFVKLSI